MREIPGMFLSCVVKVVTLVVGLIVAITGYVALPPLCAALTTEYASPAFNAAVNADAVPFDD
jgi:hypothetical protein